MAYDHGDGLWEPDDRTIVFDTSSRADYARLAEIARSRGVRTARKLDGTGFAMLYKSNISDRANKVASLRADLVAEGRPHISVR